MSPPLMPAARVVLILSLLLGLQPTTTDLYLPALPALTAHFGVVPARAQLSLTLLVLAFGLSQLVWGPLSDRYGRRPVLCWGLAGYTVAAVGSALAGSIEQLIVWRFLQGACMGAGTVCARAIVRDLHSPVEGARLMSKGLSGLGVAACLSPFLGGLISETLGWRATLATLVVAGGACLWIVHRQFRETLSRPDPEALRPAVLARTARQIAASGHFWHFALLSTCSMGGLFSFLIASSFLFLDRYHLTQPTYGLVLLSVSGCYIAGTLLCRRAVLHHGLPRAMRIGSLFTLTAGLMLAGLAWAGFDNPWALILPAWIYMLGHGFHQPCGQSGAVAPFPGMAGAASALTGFVMMSVAFLAGRWIGAAMDGTAHPLVVGMGCWGFATALMAWRCSRLAARAQAGSPA